MSEAESFFYDDPLGAYAFAVSQVPALGRKEESECLQNAQALDPQVANSARKRLMEAHLQHVVPLATAGETDQGTIRN